MAGVSIGAFGIFAVAGRRRFDELKASCAPDCTQEERGSVHGTLLAADISLAVGLVSLGIAALLYPWAPRGAPATLSGPFLPSH